MFWLLRKILSNWHPTTSEMMTPARGPKGRYFQTCKDYKILHLRSDLKKDLRSLIQEAAKGKPYYYVLISIDFFWNWGIIHIPQNLFLKFTISWMFVPSQWCAATTSSCRIFSSRPPAKKNPVSLRSHTSLPSLLPLHPPGHFLYGFAYSRHFI